MSAMSQQRYSGPQIAVHWLMVMLVAAVYLLIEWHDILPKGSNERALAKHWHEMLGLLIFALAFVRAALRVCLHDPEIIPPLPVWQQILAKAMHGVLYAWLFCLPLLGWMYLSAKGTAIPFFGLQVPALPAPGPEWAKSIKSIHIFLGKAGYVLIGLHALAALIHHYLVRDNTLSRMLPSLPRKKGSRKITGVS